MIKAATHIPSLPSGILPSFAHITASEILLFDLSSKVKIGEFNVHKELSKDV